jgi:hypothetical protein
MRPDEVEEWLQRDTRNLTLAVYTVLKATVEDARPRVWFMAGLTKRLPHLQVVNTSSATRAPYKRHHTARGGFRWPSERRAPDRTWAAMRGLPVGGSRLGGRPGS